MTLKTFSLLFGLLLALTAGSLRAQDPEPQDLEKELRRILNQDPSIMEPEMLLKKHKDDLRHWPRHRDGEHAVKQVLQGGRDMIPLLLDLLDERDYRLKPAVAFMLSQLITEQADREAATEKVLPLLEHPKLKSSTRVLLQSLHRIDPEATEKRCLDMLVSTNTAYRRAAFALLNTQDCGVTVADLMPLLDAASGAARRRVFQLLIKEPSEDLDRAALKLVGDDHPALAADITDYLSVRNNPVVLAGITERLDFEPERRFAFALIIAANLENNYSVILLDDGMVPDLDPYLSNRDPLFRLAAACALCNICRRSGREADVNLIRNKIVPAFMDVFLKNRYFKDFNGLLPAASESMRLLTGSPFTTDLTFWHEWWRTEGRAFVQNLFLITVDPGQAVNTVVTYMNTGPEGGIYSFVGEGLLHDETYVQMKNAFFLTERDMQTLIDYLYGRGFFERPSLSAAASPRSIEMRLENRGRLVDCEGEGDLKFNEMVARLEESYRLNLWQVLKPEGVFVTWWENRYNWWMEQTDECERVNRMLEDLLNAYEILPDDVILTCAEYLESSGQLDACLQETQAIALLAGLGKDRFEIDEVVEGVAHLIVSSKNAAFLEPLVLYLYGSYGEDAYPLLKEAMVGLDGIETSLSDTRWFVRVVAAQAAPKLGTGAIPRLTALLGDERPEVRHAAINSLAGFNRPDSHDALMGVMASGDPGDQASLMKALGARRVTWATELYATALQGEDPVLWILALQGLAALPRTDVESAEVVMKFIHDRGLDSEAGIQGLDALKSMGGDASRETLLGLLAKAKDSDVERAIIFGLAILGETKVFPRLQECMLDQEYREHALSCMAFLLVSDFGGETWRYREYWEKNTGQSQAFFLRVALGVGEEPQGTEEAYEGIAKEDLVRALRHDQWPVRTAALRILEEGVGQSFGELTRYSSDKEVEAVASAWEIWLKSA